MPAGGSHPAPIPHEKMRQALVNVLLATRSLDPARLAASLGCGPADVLRGLEDLAGVLEELGLRVEESERGWRLVRTAEMERLVEQYRGGASLREETLLTLALVARRGPSTMPEIGKIRRAENVRDAFETLLAHGLLEEAGRRPARGRPFVYRATEAGQLLLAGRRKTPAASAPSPVAPHALGASAPEEVPEPFDGHDSPPPRRDSPPQGALQAEERPVAPETRPAASRALRSLEIEVSVPDRRIWRRFLVPEDASFADLHEAIQDASGSWEDLHLWEFRVADLSIGPPELQSIERDASEVRVMTELVPAGRCTYRYDFGDGWQVDVRLRAIVDDRPGTRRKLLAGAGVWPPEDCGGPLLWRGRGGNVNLDRIRSAFDR